MIGWVRPQIADPGARRGAASGRARRARARAAASARSMRCRNGDLVRLAPATAGIIDEVPAGRLYKDGALLVDAEARTVADRRRLELCRHRLGRAGADRQAASSSADPEIELIGIPERDRRRRADARDRLRRRASRPSSRCRARAGAIPRRSPRRCARAVRAAIARRWGKKPMCHVHVLDGIDALRRTAEDNMIGRLNHVAIAVRDIAKASQRLSRHARRGGLGAGAAAGARRDHRVHHAAEHQDRAARAARRGLADRQVPRAQSGRRHPSRLLRGRRHPRRARPAQARRARACSATASRRSARTASRCCSCTRRISAARWSSSSRRRCRAT